MRTPRTLFPILAMLLLLIAPLASAELVINTHSVGFSASSPYNEQLKLCSCETKTDSITVENTGSFPGEFTVEVRSAYPRSIRAPSTMFSLDPGETHTFPIYIEDSCGAIGTFPYEVVIANQYGRIERIQRSIDVSQCQTAALDVTPDSREIGLCEPTSLRVTARNVGQHEQNYQLSFPGYDHIMQANRNFRLGADASMTQTVNLTFACEEYGLRNIPFLLVAEDGALADAHVRVDIRNEYDIGFDVPTSMTVCADTTTSLPIRVANNAPVEDEISVGLDAPDFVAINGASEFTLDGRTDRDVQVLFTPTHEDIGTHSVLVSATDSNGGLEKDRALALTVENCYAPAIDIRTEDGAMCGQGLTQCCGEATYYVNVRNDGTREQAFQLALDAPSFFSLEETTVRLAPGQNMNVPLQADLPCSDEKYDAMVTISPVGQSQVNRTAHLRIESQTQRTCHEVAINDDEIEVRQDATVVPIIVKHTGIAGGTYDIDLDDALFSVEEQQITLSPGEQRAIHLVPKGDLRETPTGRYIVQPSLTLVSQDIEYDEHVGIELKGQGLWSRFTAWFRSLPWGGVGVCGWLIVALVAVLLILLLVLLAVYLGKLSIFPDGLYRRPLAVVKTLIVLAIALLLIYLVFLGSPTPEMTYERLADNSNPTVLEWYQNDEMTVNLGTYFDDPDSDTLSYTATQPHDITARIEGSQLTLMPDKNFVGENTLVVTASDAKGGITDSPVFLLRVIAQRDLGFLGTLHVWCCHIVTALLLAICVVLLLLAFGVKERRVNDVRDNVLVVVPRARKTARKKVAKKAAKTTRAPARTARTPRASSMTVYMAAKDGTTVHAPECVVARRIPKGRRVAYSSRSAAVKAKLVPCRLCRPFDGGI